MEKFNALERSNEMLRKMIENERSHQRENEKKRKLEAFEHVTKIKALQKKLEDKTKDVKGKANVEKDNAKKKIEQKTSSVGQKKFTIVNLSLQMYQPDTFVNLVYNCKLMFTIVMIVYNCKLTKNEVYNCKHKVTIVNIMLQL